MDNDAQRHTLGQTLALHLIPGALITAFYFLVAPPLMESGYPAQLALLLAILFVLIPFELGYLLYLGFQQNGRLSLQGVVLYREPLPFWQYLLFVPLLLIWSFAIFFALTPVDNYLVQNVFAWLPDWSLPVFLIENADLYSTQALLVTAMFGLVFNGFAGPVVEELYFRGFLLPRIPASTRWAPLVNVLLFSLYHFFSPWQNLTRILALLPLVYLVAWKKNIYLSILVHCLLNTLGMISLLGLVLQ